MIEILKTSEAFLLPNIDPSFHGTGPFPEVKGCIINELDFFESGEKANIITNLCTAIASAHHIELISTDPNSPIILTAGGAQNKYFGKWIATLTGRTVFAGVDKNGKALTETTSLGAAIVGKAGCLDIHPYDVDISSLGINYKKLTPFEGKSKDLVLSYKERFMKKIEEL